MARTTLKDFLDEAQRQSAETMRYFEVTGNLGGHYRIYLTHSENVVELDRNGEECQAYCISIPSQDCFTDAQYNAWKEANWIAQYLTIKHDEAYFHEEANPM